MTYRPCTCHPDDNPPVPCPQKFALSECKAAPEPVAWMVYTKDGKSVFVTDNPTDIPAECAALPLFTSPPAAPAPEPLIVAKECAERGCCAHDPRIDGAGVLFHPAAPVAVEQMMRSLSAWEQVWEGIRDNHEPNLNPTNKPLAVAATFQLAISRAERAEARLREFEHEVMTGRSEQHERLLAKLEQAEQDGKAAFGLSVECRARAVRAEAECERLRKLLRETRHCVHKEANDEREMEGRGYYCDLAERVNAAIAQEAKP